MVLAIKGWNFILGEKDKQIVNIYGTWLIAKLHSINYKSVGFEKDQAEQYESISFSSYIPIVLISFLQKTCGKAENSCVSWI